MVRFAIDEGVYEDLALINQSDPKAVGRVLSVLQQLETDDDLKDRLLQQGTWFGPFHILLIESQRKRNFWRLKTIDSDDAFFGYRIIYAFRPVGAGNRIPWIRVMAVIPRSDAYNEQHRSFQRAIQRYDLL